MRTVEPRASSRPMPGEDRAAPDPPRLALSRRDAASALGTSLRHFQRHVQPHLRCVYCGQLRLFPVAALERRVNEQSSRDHTERRR